MPSCQEEGSSELAPLRSWHPEQWVATGALSSQVIPGVTGDTADHTPGNRDAATLSPLHGEPGTHSHPPVRTPSVLKETYVGLH